MYQNEYITKKNNKLRTSETFSRNHQETAGFLLMLGGIVIYQFAEICSILAAKFGDDPLTHFMPIIHFHNP